jgi:hypothetical protein
MDKGKTMKRIGWAVLAVGLGLGGPAIADESDAHVNQAARYLTMPSQVGGDPVTLMVDTVFGRTWMLVAAGDGGYVWRRVFFEESGDPPEGLTRSPPRRTQ